MTQVPTVKQIVPMEVTDEKSKDHHWDYIYEPDAESALSALLSEVYRSISLSRNCRKHCL